MKCYRHSGPSPGRAWESSHALPRISYTFEVAPRRRRVVVVSRLINRVSSEPGKLAKQARNKKRIILQVPLPKAARFASKAEKPLEPTALHPMRGLPHTT